MISKQLYNFVSYFVKVGLTSKNFVHYKGGKKANTQGQYIKANHQPFQGFSDMNLSNGLECFA